MRPISAEWPLLKVQRSVASQDPDWQVSAAAVIRVQNLTGCSQPKPVRSVSEASRPLLPGRGEQVSMCPYARQWTYP